MMDKTDQIMESQRKIIASLTDPKEEAMQEKGMFQFVIKPWWYSAGPLICILYLALLTNIVNYIE